MAEPGLQEAAIEELYGLDPAAFLDRRNELAAAAKESGDKEAAGQIAALRKPTQSAHALNMLVRSDPAQAEALVELSAEFRTAERSLDGAALRELTKQRRKLIDDLARQAFRAISARSPSSGLREEVVSTLNAALADPGVAEQLCAGTLLRAARWDGFGSAAPPQLSVVRPVSGARATQTQRKPRRLGVLTGGKGDDEARKAAEAAERERVRLAQEEAESKLREAGEAVTEAGGLVAEQDEDVRILAERLTDARRRLDELRLDLRRAEHRQRKAQAAHDRLTS